MRSWQGQGGARVQVRARTTPAGVPCGGGGDRATDEAPKTRRPNAAQSVVPGGLRAHTGETASRGGGSCRKWSQRSALPPIPCPWGDRATCRAGVHAHGASQGTRGGDKEESRRHDAQPDGSGRTLLSVASRTEEGRRAPWGCDTGAPYRGTASPPPPLPHLALK